MLRSTLSNITSVVRKWVKVKQNIVSTKTNCSLIFLVISVTEMYHIRGKKMFNNKKK